MKPSHIGLLQCIECAGALALIDDRTTRAQDDSIKQGVLRCQHCGELFPIIDGVVVFFKKMLLPLFLTDYEKRVCVSLGIAVGKVPEDLTEETLLTKRVADNWSYQWNTESPWGKEDFDKDDYRGDHFFRKFTQIEPEEYAGKRVVVWCGGNGREAYHISKNAPRLLIVNELGDEIYRISGLIDRGIDLLLLRGDMLNRPLRGGVADISICDHALHHIVDKPGAFSVIVDVLAPRGTVSICVYSYENNFLMTHIIEPLKNTLHRMPLKVQEKIALLPAAIIYSLIKLFYVPANAILPAGLCNKIPFFAVMIYWSKGPFAMIKVSCFDLIHAPVSYYFRQDEVRELVRQENCIIDKLINTHGTTWSMTARKW